jgi:hypothetical protein
MTPTSSASCIPLQGQLPLFPPLWTVNSTMRPISPCPTCGLRIGAVGPGSGPHYQSLRCSAGHFVAWLPRPKGD